MARISSKSITSVLFTAAASIIISFAISSNVYAQQDHSIASNTYPINAAESVSIPFTIPDGVTNAYLSGTILITGGIFSDIDFSIVNSNTGAQIMTQTYHSQGNIGLYLPAGSYDVVLHNGAILAGEVHTATLTLNVNY